MKYVFTIILTYLFLTGNSQIIINGKVKNYDGTSKIYYTPTVDGISFSSKEITPTTSGSFKIKYESEGLGTTRVNFNSLTFPFFHDSHAEIIFVIDQSKIKFPKNGDKSRRDHIRDSVKQLSIVSIEGDFSEINRFYNKTIRSSTRVFSVEGCDYSKLIQNIQTGDEVIHVIDSLTQVELNQIAQLGKTVTVEIENKKEVTPEMKQFLENQVYSFYANVFLSGMMLKRHEQGRKLLQDPNSPLLIYNTQWESLVERFFYKAPKRIKPATSTSEYNELLLNMMYTLADYKKYDFDPPTTTDEQLVVEQLLRPKITVLDSLGLLNDKAIFVYKLHSLSRFLNTQTFYSPVLLNAINELNLQYPNSQHLLNFNSQVEVLKTYLKTTSGHYEKSTIIKSNYIQLSDLLEEFKGKNILIDIWATWCGPCIEDFNHKAILKPFIDSGEISILYISIDKLIWEKKWKENMKFNQLEGYHVLADDVLIENIWKSLGGMQGVIPRYALIDKKGKTYLNEAARPSQGQQLVKQIEGLLQTNNK